MDNLDHNICFKREGSAIKVYITTRLPHKSDESGGTDFVFSYDCKCTQYAGLLLKYLREQHLDSIVAIRKAEFKSGWKHGRAKKKGLKYYLGWFMSTMKPIASHT